jgi:transcriptional regulator with XRE-family HTH domain
LTKDFEKLHHNSPRFSGRASIQRGRLLMNVIEYKKRYIELSDMFGERLKEVLKYSRVTQAELGSRLGKSQNAVHKWINKTGSLPNVITFGLVCEILQVDPRFFFDPGMKIEDAFSSYGSTTTGSADDVSILDIKKSIDEIKTKLYGAGLRDEFESLSDHDRKVVLSLIRTLKGEG